MKRLVQTSIGVALVAIVVASTSGTEEHSSATDDSVTERAPNSQTHETRASSIGSANWSLRAEPGIVRKHQRIDPATGKPIPLTEEQREASEYDGLSAIERDEAASNKAATDVQVTFGDPDAKLRKVR